MYCLVLTLSIGMYNMDKEVDTTNIYTNIQIFRNLRYEYGIDSLYVCVREHAHVADGHMPMVIA